MGKSSPHAGPSYFQPQAVPSTVVQPNVDLGRISNILNSDVVAGGPKLPTTPQPPASGDPNPPASPPNQGKPFNIFDMIGRQFDQIGSPMQGGFHPLPQQLFGGDRPVSGGVQGAPAAPMMETLK